MIAVDRRSILAGTAGLLLGAVGRARAAAIPAAGDIEFELYRAGDRIGTHRLRFERNGQDLIVQVEIDIEVKLAFVTIFRYRHRNREVWRGGRLIALNARTDRDGDDYRVVAEAGADGLLVDSTAGRFTAPADTVSTSWWNDAYVRREQLLDSEKGRMMRAATEIVGQGPFEAGGRPLQATHYRTSGEVKVQTWFAQDQWVGMSFIAYDEEVVYRRVDGNLPRPA